jgi:glycolate oxidase iron-sulfur subunit
MLPASLQAKVPARTETPVHTEATAAAPVRASSGRHSRRVLMLEGCVQPAMRPNINRATRRVLDAAGIDAVSAPGAGCCGAIRFHLSDRDGGLADMRRNIDAWWPMIASGEVDCIVINASGCSVAVKDYGHALQRDPAYAEKAARISAAARDLSELLPEIAGALKGRLRPRTASTLALHTPCTLQHGQRLRGGIEPHLRALGIDVGSPAGDAHLCCGSAGTYSVLQPELSTALRDRKLAALGAQEPDCIVSANIGCIQHLQSGTATPVRHWIEIIDEALVADSAGDEQGRG